MGVAVYVEGYIKEPTCIVGELSRLGWYEVELDKAKRMKLDCAVLHSGDAVLLHATSDYNWYDYGFECRAELSFFDNMYDASNTTLDDEYCIMFEPKIIWSAVTKILKNYQVFLDTKPTPVDYLTELNRLKETLNLIIADEGMVRISNM